MRVSSKELELKPEFTGRPTTTLTCFQAMIQSLSEVDVCILDHVILLQFLALTEQVMEVP